MGRFWEVLKITPTLLMEAREQEKAWVQHLLSILRAGRAGILLSPDLCP